MVYLMPNYANPFQWINYVRPTPTMTSYGEYIWDPLRSRYVSPTESAYEQDRSRLRPARNMLFGSDVSATPGGSSYWNENPDISYGVFTNRVGGPRRYNDWLRGQYGRLYGGFNSQMLSGLHPGLKWLDYLSGQNLGHMWNQSSMTERGITPAPSARRLF